MNIEIAMVEHGAAIVFRTPKFYRRLQRDVHGYWTVLEWKSPRATGRGRVLYNTDGDQHNESEETRAVKALLSGDTVGSNGPRINGVH